jgi:FkbM family methyltransferase
VPLLIKMPENRAVLSALGPYPRSLNMLGRRQTAVQRQLRRAGLAGYEPMTQATLLSIMQHAPRQAAFFDVGAHIGLYSAMISAVYAGNGVRTFAFEPTPDTARICRAVRKYNNLDYVVVETALSREPGVAALYLSNKTESSNSLNPAFRAHTQEVIVPMTTLDAFAVEAGVDPHLIKIDVETQEPQVIRGALELIARARPWIVCEILPDADSENLAELLARLTDLGYAFRQLTPELPWTLCRSAEDLQQLAQLPVRDWLLAPKKPTGEFFATVRGWLAAIAECDETTNQLIPGGDPLPAGWNSPYPAGSTFARLAQRRSAVQRSVLEWLRR